MKSIYIYILFFLFSSYFHTISAQVNTSIVLKYGDAVAGGIVTNIQVPFVNGDGAIGFVGTTDIGGTEERFIWFDDAAIFVNADGLPDNLSGAEAYMGIGNNMEFIYSPSFNGNDAVYTHNGLLAQENTQAPGFPNGINSTFHSRPRMAADGTSYWVSGFNDGMGGTASIGRIFYQADPSGTITPLLTEGTNIQGQLIDDGSAIAFDYDFSDDNSNIINEVNFNTGTTLNDGALILKLNTIIAQEASPNGTGDNWDNFDLMGINDNGDYVFSGDTDGDLGTDEFIAVNGNIVIREGDIIDGTTLTSSATVRGLHINNSGQVAHLWGISGGDEILFLGDVSDLATTSTAILRTGDMIDTDGNGTGDFTITDFNTFGQSIALSNTSIFVDADWEDDMGTSFTGVLEISDVILPVNLTFFEAQSIEKEGVKLLWETLSEINIKGFELERTDNLRDWTTLHFEASQALGFSVNNYQFMDDAPLIGKNYYRLKILNDDGSHHFSNTISVTFHQETPDIRIFPTLVKNELFINYKETPDAIPHISIFNWAGNQVAEFDTKNTHLNLEHKLAPGQYVITITFDNYRWSEKFLKVGGH